MTVGKRTTLFSDQTPRSVHCATLTELPSGEILAAAYAFSYETSLDTTVLTSRYGKSGWTASETVISLPGISVGNPVLFTDDRGVVQLYFVTVKGGGWTDAVVCVQESTDNGHTFGPARVVHEQPGLMTKTRPLMANGRLILPVYDERTWCSMVLVRESEAGPWRLHGDTTSRGKTIQPAIVELGNGDLLMLSRSSQGAVYESLSKDGGFTWTASQPTDLPNPNSGVDLLKLRSGELLLTYNPLRRGREELALTLSRDEGRTWSAPLTLESARGEFSYPYAIQALNGTVHLMYTEQRTHIVHVELPEDELISRFA